MRVSHLLFNEFMTHNTSGGSAVARSIGAEECRSRHNLDAIRHETKGSGGSPVTLLYCQWKKFDHAQPTVTYTTLPQDTTLPQADTDKGKRRVPPLLHWSLSRT